MNTKKIKELIDILNDSNLVSMSYKDSEFEVVLDKGVSLDNSVNVTTEKINSNMSNTENTQSISEGELIKSVLVGVFYDKPSPDKDVFVKVGDKVAVGDVICIIEAMKVMNEIKSNKSGVISAVHVKEGDTVDFDQPLFTIE